jgi:hypothetical protein
MGIAGLLLSFASVVANPVVANPVVAKAAKPVATKPVALFFALKISAEIGKNRCIVGKIVLHKTVLHKTVPQS